MGSTDLVTQAERATDAQLQRARRQGTRLPAGAAQAVRDLAPAVKQGAKWLTRKEQPTTWHVNVSDEIRRRIADQELRFVTSKGRTLAELRDKSGEFAGKLDISEVAPAGKGVKPGQVAMGGAAVAWQAMAIATQQHYLVEITGKLSRIEGGLTDLLERQMAENHARLLTIVDDLTLIEQHIAEGDELSANDRQNVTSWHGEAKRIALAAGANADRVLGAPERDPMDALPDLALADRAASVAARCAATLLRMPYETPEKRLTAFAHYAEDTRALVDGVTHAMLQLNRALTANDLEWLKYEQTRPTRKPLQLWNATGGRVKGHIGLPQPRFPDHRHRSPDIVDEVERRASLGSGEPVAIAPATIVIDGDEAYLVPGDE